MLIFHTTKVKTESGPPWTEPRAAPLSHALSDTVPVLTGELSSPVGAPVFLTASLVAEG